MVCRIRTLEFDILSEVPLSLGTELGLEHTEHRFVDALPTSENKTSS